MRLAKPTGIFQSVSLRAVKPDMGGPLEGRQKGVGNQQAQARAGVDSARSMSYIRPPFAGDTDLSPPAEAMTRGGAAR